MDSQEARRACWLCCSLYRQSLVQLTGCVAFSVQETSPNYWAAWRLARDAVRGAQCNEMDSREWGQACWLACSAYTACVGASSQSLPHSADESMQNAAPSARLVGGVSELVGGTHGGIWHHGGQVFRSGLKRQFFFGSIQGTGSKYRGGGCNVMTLSTPSERFGSLRSPTHTHTHIHSIAYT